MVTAHRACALALVVAAVALAGCEPDIVGGAYYCGPERACPPDLRCDEATAVCRYPREVEAFTCPDGTNAHEPDDTVAAAFDLGTAGCGVGSVAADGCIDNAPDLDHWTIHTPEGCGSTVHVTAAAPLAFAPVSLEVLAADGTQLVEGTVCDDLDDAGQVRRCADLDLPGGSTAVLRLGLLGGEDCDGACAYNRYHLSVN